MVTGVALPPDSDGTDIVCQCQWEICKLLFVPQATVIVFYANHMGSRFPMWLSSNIQIYIYKDYLVEVLM